MQKLRSEKIREVFRFNGFEKKVISDQVSTEEPLEIKLAYGPTTSRQQASLAVTMRTPGTDFELAEGFLLTEGLISRPADVISKQFIGSQLADEAQENVVLVNLHPSVQIDLQQLSRHFYTSSSCGICGKASLDLVKANIIHLLRPNYPQISVQQLFSLPEKLRTEQASFSKTGGIHAAGLFNPAGDLLILREDVGRHNAMDKLIGAAMAKGFLPLKEYIILLSGRASFELVQKALMAGCGVLAAVGAPSSLAIELAETHDMSLIGFLKGNSFNVYTGIERIQ